MSDLMTIRVRPFAGLREALGFSESTVTVPVGTDVAGLVTRLAADFPAARLTARRFTVAVNRTYAPPDRVLADGDEVALIPPVSGGSGRDELVDGGPGRGAPSVVAPPRAGTERAGTERAGTERAGTERAGTERAGTEARPYEITDRPISLDDVAGRVAAPQHGGITVFAGTVRGVTRPGQADEARTDYLEYEAYPEMAEAAFAAIAAEARERWPGIAAVAVVHRVGRLEVGDTAIAIAVAAAHRAETFDACHFIIDRIKQSAPIWKREVGPDGSSWVEGPESAI